MAVDEVAQTAVVQDCGVHGKRVICDELSGMSGEVYRRRERMTREGGAMIENKAGRLHAVVNSRTLAKKPGSGLQCIPAKAVTRSRWRGGKKSVAHLQSLAPSALPKRC